MFAMACIDKQNEVDRKRKEKEEKKRAKAAALDAEENPRASSSCVIL